MWIKFLEKVPQIFGFEEVVPLHLFSDLKLNVIQMLKLTKAALEGINSTECRAKLMIALSCSEQSIYRYIRENSDDLTKAAALRVIREETGLQDEDILEESDVNEPQN